ncbi:MAG: hypothetical protein MUE73_13145 [Planctomycetes bacterium]|nr:hypothetical protein [Planctomycetota bacterium]
MRNGALMILVLFTACEIPESNRPEEKSWYSSQGFEALDEDLVWMVLELELSRRGYTLDPMACDRITGDFETRWITNLNPFRYEGRRTKYVGRVEAVADQPGWFRVRGLVWTQRNADLKDPMDPLKAIWQDDAPDDTATEVFLYSMVSHFETPSDR